MIQRKGLIQCRHDWYMLASVVISCIATLAIFLWLRALLSQCIEVIAYYMSASEIFIMMCLSGIIFVFGFAVMTYAVGITEHDVPDKTSLRNIMVWGVLIGYSIGGMLGFMYHISGFILSIFDIYAQIWVVFAWIIYALLIFGIGQYFSKRDQPHPSI